MTIFGSRTLSAGVAFLVFAVCAQAAEAANKRVEVAAEPCNYLLTFDPETTEEARLTDTYELLIYPLWSPGFGNSVFSVGEIETIDLAGIERRCAESIDRVKSLKLLPLPGAEAHRGAIVAELEDTCRYDRLNAEGYRNPSLLRQYTAAAQCFRYVDALEGKSDLAATFEEVSREHCEGSKSCLADNLKRWGDSAEEMKVYVHTFGWGNCSPAFNLRNTAKNAEKGRKLGQALLKAYRAREVNCETEEP